MSRVKTPVGKRYASFSMALSAGTVLVAEVMNPPSDTQAHTWTCVRKPHGAWGGTTGSWYTILRTTFTTIDIVEWKDAKPGEPTGIVYAVIHARTATEGGPDGQEEA